MATDSGIKSSAHMDKTKISASVSMVCFAPSVRSAVCARMFKLCLTAMPTIAVFQPSMPSQVARNAPHAMFRDVQGNVIKPTAVRNAKIDLGHVTFNETWIVGSIAAPMPSLVSAELYCSLCEQQADVVPRR